MAKGYSSKTWGQKHRKYSNWWNIKNSNGLYQSINTESIDSYRTLKNNIKETNNPINTRITTNNTINEINVP